ncbi:hypothetical protein BC832DRAFT_156261 [Gaertneriomyces semiglobifer]|nr:hypothetical protein BC832DRAFT_156261 [Gaertneriomyces semiglobifer]
MKLSLLCAAVAALCASRGATAKASIASFLISPPLDIGSSTRKISWATCQSVLAHVLDAPDGFPALSAMTNQDRDDFNAIATLQSTKPNLVILADGAESMKIGAGSAYEIPDEYPRVEITAVVDDLVRTISRDADGSGAIMISRSTTATGKSLSRVAIGIDKIHIAASSSLPETVYHTLDNIRHTTYTDLKSHIVEKYGVRAAFLDEKVHEDVRLMAEIEFVSSVWEAFKVQVLGDKRDHVHYPDMVVHFDSLQGMRAKYGVDSATYREAQDLLRETIEEITATHNAIFPTARTFTVVSSFLSSTSPASLKAKRQPPGCPTTEDDCKTAFSNCTAHGTCVKSATTECWECQCFNYVTDDAGNKIGTAGLGTYTGNMCQFEDISTEFHLVFWTSVSLIIALMFIRVF